MRKNVLVLGGSSSIGMACIKVFLSNNWVVHAHYNKNNNDFKKLKLNNKNMLNLYKCDFANQNQINKFTNKISKKDMFYCKLNWIYR